MILPKLLLLLVPLLMFAETQNNLQRGLERIRIPIQTVRLMPTVSTILDNPMTNKNIGKIIKQEDIHTLHITDIKVTYKKSEIISVLVDKAQEAMDEEPTSTILDTNNYAKKFNPVTTRSSLSDFTFPFRSKSTFRPSFSELSPSPTVLQNILKTNTILTSPQRKILTESHITNFVTNTTKSLESDTIKSKVMYLGDITTLVPTSKPDKIVNATKVQVITNSSINNLILEKNVELTQYQNQESDFIVPLPTDRSDTTKLVSNKTPMESIRLKTKSTQSSITKVLSPSYASHLGVDIIEMADQESSFHSKLNEKPEQITATNKQPVDININAQPIITCPRRYGFFPTPNSNCGHFIICQEGIATTISCPPGLAFNMKIGTCDWPINVPGCNPDVFQDFTCPTTRLNTFGKPSNLIHNFKYKNSCKKYIACLEGRPRLLSCDAGLFFDEQTEKCVDSSQIKNCKS